MRKSKVCSAIALFLDAENPLRESPKTNGTGPNSQTPRINSEKNHNKWVRAESERNIRKEGTRFIIDQTVSGFVLVIIGR
jgi:hypothetical protein